MKPVPRELLLRTDTIALVERAAMSATDIGLPLALEPALEAASGDFASCWPCEHALASSNSNEPSDSRRNRTPIKHTAVPSSGRTLTFEHGVSPATIRRQRR
jgi:hypothetical protein